MGKDLNGKELGKGLSQRKDGRYEARFMVDGKTVRMYDKNISNLRKEFDKARAHVILEEPLVIYKTPKITVNLWFTEWFDTYKAPTLKNELSIKTYERKVRNTVIKLIGDKDIKDITHMEAQTVANKLIMNGYKDKSVKEAIGVMRECFDAAILNKMIVGNPFINIAVKTSNTQSERRVLTPEEQKLFLNEVENSFYYEVYAILLSTGLRIGELSGLQWGDIDWRSRCINVKRSLSSNYIDGKKIEELTTPKTFNSYRSIPFFGETEHLLKSWKQKQDECRNNCGNRWRLDPNLGDLIFTNTKGSPVTRFVIIHDIDRAVKNINLKEEYNASVEGRVPTVFAHLHPHAFRHTFATRCFEKGLDPVFIQNVMGHSNYNTTLSYTHLLDAIKKKEVEKAGDFLG